jgi:hypothetical protein
MNPVAGFAPGWSLGSIEKFVDSKLNEVDWKVFDRGNRSWSSLSCVCSASMTGIDSLCVHRTPLKGLRSLLKALHHISKMRKNIPVVLVKAHYL